jgi:hypothetical protein
MEQFLSDIVEVKRRGREKQISKLSSLNAEVDTMISEYKKS